MKHRFSVSDIITAHKCPRHFFLKRMGYSAYFSFKNSNHVGTFVHKVLSDFATSIKKEILFKTNNDKNLIETELYESFKRVSFTSKFNVNYETAWKYVEMAGAYFQSFAFGKTEKEIREMFLLSEEPFKFQMNRAIISGKFDLLMKVGKEAKIIDFKTRKTDLEIDAIQIALYKFAVEELYKINVNPSVVYIEEGGIREENFSEEEFKEIVEQIKSIVNDMVAFLTRDKVPPASMDKDICRHCSLKYNCKNLIKEVFNE